MEMGACLDHGNTPSVPCGTSSRGLSQRCCEREIVFPAPFSEHTLLWSSLPLQPWGGCSGISEMNGQVLLEGGRSGAHS